MPGTASNSSSDGLPDAVQVAAKIGEQRFAPRRSDAGHIVQLGSRLLFTT